MGRVRLVRCRLPPVFPEVGASAGRELVMQRVAVELPEQVAVELPEQVAVELPEQVARERDNERVRARAWVRAGKGFQRGARRWDRQGLKVVHRAPRRVRRRR